MAGKSAKACRVKLEGEWVVDRASELKTVLIDTLAQIGKSATGRRRTEIDMTGITDLDACCCQLLAVFLEELKRRGVVPLPCGMSQTLTEKTALLGFSELFETTGP